MPQLTIYLDKESQCLIETAAAKADASLSSWARVRLVEAAAPKGWPIGFSQLFGSVTDESFKEPTELGWDDDNERRPL